MALKLSAAGAGVLLSFQIACRGHIRGHTEGTAWLRAPARELRFAWRRGDRAACPRHIWSASSRWGALLGLQRRRGGPSHVAKPPAPRTAAPTRPAWSYPRICHCSCRRHVGCSGCRSTRSGAGAWVRRGCNRPAAPARMGAGPSSTDRTNFSAFCCRMASIFHRCRRCQTTRLRPSRSR